MPNLPAAGGPAGARRVPPDEGPEYPLFDAPGLRVTLERIEGVTPKRLIPTGGLMLQCPPLDEFAIDSAHSHNDFETFARQRSRKGVPQLDVVSFDTLVVDYARYAVNQDAADIEEITEDLQAILKAGLPFLMTAEHYPSSGAGPELQMAATMRSLRVAERAGEGDARYLNMSFVEYDDGRVSRRGLGRKRAGTPELPTTCFIRADGLAYNVNGKPISNRKATFARISTFYYGDPGYASQLKKKIILRSQTKARSAEIGNNQEIEGLFLFTGPKSREDDVTMLKIPIPRITATKAPESSDISHLPAFDG